MATRKPDAGKRGTSKGKGPRTEEIPPNPALEWTKSIAIAVVLFLVLRSFLVQTFVIISGSMEGTLLVGDMLVVNRAAIGSRVPATNIRIPGYSEPNLWDVLVFDPHHEEDLKLIKRLVGMPGDTLEMRNRALYRNGQAVNEPYVTHSNVEDEDSPMMDWQHEYVTSDVDRGVYSPTRDTWGPLVIPEAHYFMLGDNREQSLDSRYWGLLEDWRVEGRAMFTYFSYNKPGPGEYGRPFPWIREVRWGRIFDGIS